MTTANWVKPEDITVFEPATAEELLERREHIDLINGDDTTDNFWEWAPEYFPSFWLFYVDDEPAGYIRRDFFRRSVELHGGVREGFEDRGIAHYAVMACLNHTFFIVPRGYDHENQRQVLGYPKVIIPVDDSDPEVKGFALRWGFKRTEHQEGDKWYWKLTREDFIKRFNGQQERSTEGESGES